MAEKINSPEKDKTPSKTVSDSDLLEFLMDKELRRERLHGRPSKVKRIEDMIRARFGKTIPEKEQEAEEARVANLTTVPAETED